MRTDLGEAEACGVQMRELDTSLFSAAWVGGQTFSRRDRRMEGFWQGRSP
jgi:hypothetical protein